MVRGQFPELFKETGKITKLYTAFQSLFCKVEDRKTEDYD
jgi:hypothetical protein